jgi:diguanylate cyclase (GGDEF)-like protein
VNPRASRATAGGLTGALLALGAPLGLLVLRSISSGRASLGDLAAEVRSDPLAYAYVTLSTLVVFTLFGRALGAQADRLYELSASDPLTLLRNRRAFEARLREEFARSVRHGTPLSLLLVDLDGLKALNDAAGHRAGDEALMGVAAALRGGSRQTDVAARWGGDEFALLAPETGAEEASHLAERVRELAGASGHGVSVSVGVSVLVDPAQGGDAEAMVRAADAALYEAKRTGRNRVVMAESRRGEASRGAA